MNPEPNLQNLWARLIAQNPDKHDIRFFTHQDQPNQYEFDCQWKIYQTPDSSTTKILNLSDSCLKVHDCFLEKNQEHILYGGEIISWSEQEDGTSFDYVFVLMKPEPKNELKWDRSEESSSVKIVEKSSDSKSVKSQDNNLFQQTFESFLYSLTDEEEEKDQKIVKENFLIIRDENGVYEGFYVDGKNHGEGEMTYRDGTIYEGAWKDDKREGKGKLTLPNGDIYESIWTADVIQPIATIHFADGKEYEGEIDQANLTKHGKGALILKEDVKIEGNWVNDVIEPQVTIYYYWEGKFDRAKYEGPIDPKTLNRNGKGILTYKNGDSYEGNFAGEHYNGQGIYKWKDGDVYEGEFKNGERNGWGIMKYANGNKLECSWKKGKSKGKGTVLLANGGVLEGKWAKDNLQTPVIINYRNGDQYKGAVCQENFKRDGKGVLSYKNGDVYDGYWKNDKKNGRGSLKYGHRLELVGEWKKGESVGKGKFVSGELVLEGKWQKR